MMHFVYALINFLLLAGVVFLFGRKSIIGIFRTRRERIGRELDEISDLNAEAGSVSAPAERHIPAENGGDAENAASDTEAAGDEAPGGETADAEAADAEIAAIAAAGNAEAEAIISRAGAEAEGERREALLETRGETLERLRQAAAELLSGEPYQSRMRAHEAEIADNILNLIRITPGDVAYLKTHDVLYVTLTSAFELDRDIVDRIGAAAGKMLEEVGGKPSYWVKVDPSLIGGLRFRVGDTVYDCTVANALYRLTGSLGSRPVPMPAPGQSAADAITSDILAGIADVTRTVDVFQQGRVISISDGICWLDGLADIMYGEVVEFACGERGMILDIEPDRIGCVIFGKYEHIESGSRVRRVGRMASVPVGDALLGRVLDPLGAPIDGKGRLRTDETRPIECAAPVIPDRKSVSVPLHTGIKAIDALVPIGRGQRELIIGDRQSGKSSIALDTIINQKGKGVLCVYVAIGQKEATVAEIVSRLSDCGAMDYTVVVSATASGSASLQYIAPFAGTAMGEYFMYSGRDVLIIYDDLSKHAVAYRELSLLLHRPAGREAYPGDVFYLHARLLERSARLCDARGGGSMTALPMIETQAGDISAYIPTNVISITDGQIFLESDLFNEGQRPAVNVGLSVSRVGSAAQTRLMKQISSRLRMQLAQYRELQTFAQFGSDLDENTRRTLASGERMTAALRQGRYAPLSDGHQVLLLCAVSWGFADGVSPDDMESFEAALYRYFGSEQPRMMARLETGEKLDDGEIADLKECLGAYARTL